MAAWMVIMAVVIVAGSMGAAAHASERAPFADVPSRTWPYAVIDHFAERGWVTHYPGDLFASHRTITRYEMALATRDIVERAGTSASWTLSPKETLWLQSLVKEYAPELELLGYRLERLEPSPVRRTGSPDAPWSAGRMARTVGGGRGSPWTLALWGESGRGLIPRGAESWAQLVRGRGAPAAGGHPGGDDRGWQLAAAWPAGDSRAVPFPSGAGSGEVIVNGMAAGLPSGEQRAWRLTARVEQDRPSQRKGVVVGAQAMVRFVERASAAWIGPGFPSPSRLQEDERELRSLDLVLDLGDVRLTSPRSDLRQSLDPWQERTAIGPVGFTSAVTSVAPRMTSSGLVLHDELQDIRTTTASVAGVGMDVVIPSARLRLGWRYEGELGDRLALRNGTTVAGVEYQIDSRAQAVAGFVLSDEEEGQTRTTQLGLRYSLGRDASVLLGYRLIDFNMREDKRDETLTKMATAEFSLRF